MGGVVAAKPQRDDPGPGAGPHDFGIVWATGLSQPGHRFDVRYRIDGGDWRTWVKNTTSAVGVFGFENVPVATRPNRTYRVQVRPELEADPQRKGDWSPSLTVKT